MICTAHCLFFNDIFFFFSALLINCNTIENNFFYVLNINNAYRRIEIIPFAVIWEYTILASDNGLFTLIAASVCNKVVFISILCFYITGFRVKPYFFSIMFSVIYGIDRKAECRYIHHTICFFIAKKIIKSIVIKLIFA